MTHANSEPTNQDRLFSGVFPCGIRYADRACEENGDYARLAFLPFDTLMLDVHPNCPPDLRARIEPDASKIQARRGELFQVSTCSQMVLLGSRAS